MCFLCFAQLLLRASGPGALWGVGVFSFESILSLLVEYLINAVRFFVIVLTAFFAGKEVRLAKQTVSV